MGAVPDCIRVIRQALLLVSLKYIWPHGDPMGLFAKEGYPL